MLGLAHDVARLSGLRRWGDVFRYRLRAAALPSLRYDVRPDTTGTDITRPLHVPTRASRDTRVNGHGKKLLQLMNNYNLVVANGSVCGELAGEFTCCQWNGLSIVDMLIIDRLILQRLNDWKF